MIERSQRARRRTGRRRQAAVVETSGPSLVVATYNVHTCVGVDRRYDPARVAAVLRELDADIIGLQEVESGHREPSAFDQEGFLAAETGMRSISGPRPNGRRRFGNVILTRLPVLAVRHIDLSIDGCEPRGALDVDLAFQEGVLRVVATHFGLRGAERRKQTQILLGALGDRATAAAGEMFNGTPLAGFPGGLATPDAILMMGDLNEWRGRRGGIPALDRKLGRTPMPRTFPSWCPILPLDRIYAGPPALLGEFTVHRSPLARVASDHLPLRARLAWHRAD